MYIKDLKSAMLDELLEVLNEENVSMFADAAFIKLCEYEALLKRLEVDANGRAENVLEKSDRR